MKANLIKCIYIITFIWTTIAVMIYRDGEKMNTVRWHNTSAQKFVVKGETGQMFCST